jgi:hypothetical protein
MSEFEIHDGPAGSPAPAATAPQSHGSDEYVRWAYKLLLGREPESEKAVRNNPFKNDRHRLVEQFLNSGEFHDKQFHDTHKPLFSNAKPSPYEYWTRGAIALVHMPKTGGSTLDSLLKKFFHPSRICGVPTASLHLYSPADLAEFDFFSGHFDYFSVNFIPRQHVRCVSIFRDPQQRLVSWYRFKRSHPLTDEFADDIFVKLANQLSPEEFFEHSDILHSTFMNNTYLFFLGSSLSDDATVELLAGPPSASNMASGNQSMAPELLAADQTCKPILERAVQRVKNLDAIGITEAFHDSVETIFPALGFSVPQSIDPVKVTDDLPDIDARFSRVPPVEMTERLSRALHRLTRYDQVIYEAAKDEFERRRSAYLAAAE